MKRLCALHQIPEQAAISFEDESLIAVRWQRTIYLYQNVCPHRGTPLNLLPDQFLCPEGKLLQCHTHGAGFEPAGGICTHGPCLGQSLTQVPFQIRDGYLFLLESE